MGPLVSARRFVAGRGRHGGVHVLDTERGNRIAVSVPRDWDASGYKTAKAETSAERIAAVCAEALNAEYEAWLASKKEGGK